MDIAEARNLLDQMQRNPDKQRAATYSDHFHQLAKFIDGHQDDSDSARVTDLCMEIRGELKVIGDHPGDWKAKKHDNYVRDKIWKGVRGAQDFLDKNYPAQED